MFIIRLQRLLFWVRLKDTIKETEGKSLEIAPVLLEIQGCSQGL